MLTSWQSRRSFSFKTRKMSISRREEPAKTFAVPLLTLVIFSFEDWFPVLLFHVQLRRTHTGSVLELLGTQRLLKTMNLDLRVLSMAIAANVLSFSDSLLSSREDCIDAFRDRMEIFLSAVKR